MDVNVSPDYDAKSLPNNQKCSGIFNGLLRGNY